MASLSGGTLTIRTEITTRPDDAGSELGRQPTGWVRLSVADTGVGMDDQVKGRLFEPFFTTKAQGTGLGLSVVQNIVQEHGGRIDVRTAPGQGSTFQVYLPALRPTRAQPQGAETAGLGEPRGHGERVLVVEDDEWVRQFTAQVLSRSGYVALEAETLAQAREILAREGHRIGLVFTDVVLADGTALDLATELLARRPDVRLLLSSGYTDDRSRLAAIRRRGLPFIHKPYTLSELLHAIRAAIEHGEAQ
jgi:CheY-like chemotaxis protein